ncbi:MAG: beta-ketoacyl-ACP synthase II [Vampirovibrionales bacterium]|nr:beta-ketoacyl-ACP synthase II [Vampirovibrionales bacterium]
MSAINVHSSKPDTQRVVITGMGAISPIGHSIEAIWASVVAGKSGIKLLPEAPAAEQTCRIGGYIPDFDPTAYMDKKEARRMDRFTQFAIAAGTQAVKQAKLQDTDGNLTIDPTRFGVVVGSGAGGITTIDEQLRSCVEKGFHRCSPFLVPMMITDMASGRLSILFGAKGPNYAIVTACATGTDAIGEAMRMIQLDEVDVVLAGGAEAPLTAISIAGFAAAKTLSMRASDPTAASRPFDKGRDGFVMSEGAGILVLESLAHAKKRGATILAEVAGYGRSSDANDVVAPCADGEGAARAMVQALRNAGLPPSAIDSINAHATSTKLGDIAETKAMKRVFGENNGQINVPPVSATKSMHGHMLGATGAVEAIITLMSLQHQILPPTINLHQPDDACDLDYVANEARPVENLRYAMSNSFGFGGHNASLIFTHPPSLN